ncbi:LCP family protein [Thermoactinomyces mirandus]|uniref:LCP family protein n=1 Tax=Thermoactinomyces mirandus TaxID=2756294 RepID=A0A7W1XUF6_9BACL|nr:LCP family protein [Thermoactinomyces mirandus]MBA4603476.1 LCP family protein [Thermoactinomyces mirandus]
MRRVDQSRISRVKKKRRKKWIIRTVSLVLLLLLGAGLYLGSEIWGVFANTKNNLGKSDLRDKQVQMDEPFTILLLGTDQRKRSDPVWRADVMMLIAVNPKTNSAKVLSIPRDTYATIANTDGMKAKLNSAAYWGYKKDVGQVVNIRKTLENLLHVPVDYYARINFQGFEDIVDALGGVEVNVKFPFHQQAIGGDMVYFEPGVKELNGSEALAYVRMRKQDPRGDLGRNERQREVVTQLIDKIAGFEGVGNFSKLMKAVGDNFEHSLELENFKALADIYRKIPKNNIENLVIKTTPENVPGAGAVLIWPKEDRQKIQQILREHLELPPLENQEQEGGSDHDDSSETENQF